MLAFDPMSLPGEHVLRLNRVSIENDIHQRTLPFPRSHPPAKPKRNLPHHNGLLPLWLLFVAHPSTILLAACANVNQVSALSIFNNVQSFPTLVFTRRVCAGEASKTNITSPLFGTWTFLSCIIRYYAAYHVDSRVLPSGPLGSRCSIS